MVLSAVGVGVLEQMWVAGVEPLFLATVVVDANEASREYWVLSDTRRSCPSTSPLPQHMASPG